MKDILHIASDEKFINAAYFQFENAFPDKNLFYILVNDVNKSLIHVKLDSNFVIIPNSVNKLKKLYKNFGDAKIICFHGLDYHRSIVLNNTPKRYKTIWLLYGFEFYNNPLIFTQKLLYDEYTYRKFKKKIFNMIDIIKEPFRNFYYVLKYNTKSPYKEAIVAMKSANILGVLYKEEYNLIVDKLKSNTKFLKFTYYPIEFIIPKSKYKVNGDNILIGNSASETNNHLEVFNILNRKILKNQRIVVPLSYGSLNYQQTILKIGYNMFPITFEPLTEFLNLQEYNEHIKKCGIVIMNHYRQQAVGNVLTTLWMGSKIFLNKKNTLYHYLKRIGVQVFLVEDIRLDFEKSLKKLSKKEQMLNKKIIDLEINQNILIKSLKNDINKILNE